MGRPVVTTIPIPETLLRGERKPHIALVGPPGTGKSSFFQAAASPLVAEYELGSPAILCRECQVDVGLEQAILIDLPPLCSLHDMDETDRHVLQYLLWGNRWPQVAAHDQAPPSRTLPPPDVLILVVDATALERGLELAQELSLLGRPLVIALNRLDEARAKGIYINTDALAEAMGSPVVPTVAHMGKGVMALFQAALDLARSRTCPIPHPPSAHIQTALQPVHALLGLPALEEAFRVPRPLLVMQLAEGNPYFTAELGSHFPELLAPLEAARQAASAALPRPLADEIHADRHHRAALLHERVTRLGHRADKAGWKRLLDNLFLHPRWGLIGSLGVFALALFMVFEVSAFLDSLSSAPLAAWVGEWAPASTPGVIGKAVAEGLVGLVGIVVPYMLPLVLLLVLLEESGIMHRVAFVVDRGFHHIGLHGGVALPFLLGLGCNVPALSAVASGTSGRDRVVASLLITFVPCSARSAIILALGAKYLGWAGVLGLFLLTLVLIAVAGRVLNHRYNRSAPGMVQAIPPYAMPRLARLVQQTWERTSDILTIVTPLLVIGSVVLALLSHFGLDDLINILLTPITHWWLGLPLALGVPILFGILRKELSLLMVFQALGTQDVAEQLSTAQIATFLVFLTFYVPCVSTFAVMLKTLGRREAFYSLGLSVSVALVLALVVRLLFPG